MRMRLARIAWTAVAVLALAASAAAVELRGKVVGVVGTEIRFTVEGDLLPQAGDPVTVSFEVPGLAPVRVGTGKVSRVEGSEVLATLLQSSGPAAIDQLVAVDAAVPVPRRGRGEPVPAGRATAPSTRAVPADLPPMPKLAGGPIPYVGLRADPLTAAARRRLDLPEFPGGLVLVSTETGGPAAAAGLKVDDVLQRCDGRDLSRLEDLTALVAAHRPGDALKLEVWRKGKPLDLTVTLADRLVGAGRACDAGAYDACEHLAWFFEHGQGIPKDAVLASALLARAAASARAACDEGGAQACEALGALYEEGRGVPSDPARAIAARRQACEGGASGSCLALGEAYQDGRGVARDDARAAGFLEKGCEGGSAHACTQLGFMYEKGRGVAADMARAAALAQKACGGGDPTGCSNLGVFYYAGQGVAKDMARAVALIGEACAGGVSHACKNLGRLYEFGDGVPADPARAFSLYERACTGGTLEACGYLGLAYKNGIGTKKDGRRAKELLSQACRDGVEWACPEAR